VAIGLLLPICLVWLWFPSDADEALFQIGARRLNEGAAYYRDFWDIKQPGIYWFYQVGDLFGLGGLGVRLLELGFALVGGLLVWRTVRHWGLHPLARVLAPVMVLGSYLLLSHRSGVGQIEGLTNVLVVTMVAACWPIGGGSAGLPRPGWRWFLAGMAGGVLGVLKLLYLPLAVILLLGALADTRVGLLGRLRLALFAAAGALVPLGATAVYLAQHEALRLAWLTAVQIPVETLGTAVMDDDRTRHVELLIGLSGLVPLALIGLAGAGRRGTRVRESTLTLLLVVSAALSLPQYPTPYRFLVTIAPLGMLAVLGVSSVLAVVERRAPGPARRRLRAAVLALLALLALPMARGPQRLIFAAGSVSSWSLAEQPRLQRDLLLAGAPLQQDVEPVRSLVTPGEPIFVLGDPRIYLLLRARQATEVSGWAATLLPQRVWAERDRELVRSRPELIYVEDVTMPQVRLRSPGLAAMLDRSYRVLGQAGAGTWYRTDTPGVPAAIPGDNRMARADPPA